MNCLQIELKEPCWHTVVAVLGKCDLRVPHTAVIDTVGSPNTSFSIMCARFLQRMCESSKYAIIAVPLACMYW